MMTIDAKNNTNIKAEGLTLNIIKSFKQKDGNNNNQQDDNKEKSE